MLGAVYQVEVASFLSPKPALSIRLRRARISMPPNVTIGRYGTNSTDGFVLHGVLWMCRKSATLGTYGVIYFISMPHWYTHFVQSYPLQ